MKHLILRLFTKTSSSELPEAAIIILSIITEKMMFSGFKQLEN